VPGLVGGGGRRAEPVVGHLQQQRVRLIAQADRGRGAQAAVLAGVGQRLLHHPVRGQLGASGQRPGRSVQAERHRHARVPRLLDQLAELVQAGQRGQAGPLVPGAQHAEQAAHLGERLAPGVRDRGQRLGHPIRVGAQHVARPVGLHHHHADVVRDHVVQLAGDPGPLGGRGDQGLLVALALQPGRAVFQRGQVRAPVAHGVAEHPRDQRGPAEDHRGQQQPVQHGQPVRPDRHRHGRARQADDQPGDRDPSRPVRGQGVQHDQDGQVGADRRGVGQDLERPGDHRDRERLDRVPAAEHHREHQARDDRQQHRHPGHDGDRQAQQGQADGGNAVDQAGMPAQPGVHRGHAHQRKRGAASRRPPPS
jgi:hypothetical protein